MNDRESLELAAKAAGGLVQWEDCMPWYIGNEPGVEYEWNPLTDDGDALRLAVNLGIHIEQNMAFKRACALWYGKSVLREELFVPWGDDRYAATRRAIVRAAAEIGLQMEEGGEA